jgi:sulfite exporter TauE/SafE
VIPAVALVMGLAGGAHCITMCGGVASAACGSSCASTTRGRATYSLAWNAGRIATYTALGAIAGAIGSAPMSFVPLETARLALRVIAALVLLGLGLHLAGLTSMFGKIERIGAPLWNRIAPFARVLLPIKSAPHAMLLGAIWGFVPCGLVYAALSLALGTGSIALGAVTMLAFGAGTLPVMAALTTIAGDLARRLATRRIAGIVVLALAVQQGHTVVKAAHLDEATHPCCHAR